jgi:hypothetical protein
LQCEGQHIEGGWWQHEFKLALRTFRSAASFVLPWNQSYTALENFLVSSQFCKEDIGPLDKQAQIPTSFTDYVLAENASKWRNSEPFQSARELKAAWQAFFSARPQSALGKRSNPQQSSGSTSRGKWPQRPTQGSTQPKEDRRRLPVIPVCYNWNKKTCNKPDGQCTTFSRVPLRHVCDERINPANLAEFCGQPHRRTLFH